MKTDQQFWEDVVTSLVPVVLREAVSKDSLTAFLAQEKMHASVFAAELSAQTADRLLALRNQRMGVDVGAQESPVSGSGPTS
jgi:hypothetical protein